jgi:hypothetical protein
MAGIKAGFGLDESTPHLTHRELQARRAEVREKFAGRGKARGRGRGRRPGRGLHTDS